MWSRAFDQLLKYDRKIGEEILKREETVDTLNKEIADYITKAMSMEISNETSIALGAYYHQITVHRADHSEIARHLQSKLNEEEKSTIEVYAQDV